jgi:hypothetical protein
VAGTFLGLKRAVFPMETILAQPQVRFFAYPIFDGSFSMIALEFQQRQLGKF